jgi:hypothetical protein
MRRRSSEHRACIVASLVLGCLALAGASPAVAQRTVVEGPGYELTEGTVVHPSIGMTTGILYNPFYVNQGATSTPVIHVRAGATISSQDSRPPGEVELLVSDADKDAARDAAPSVEFRAGALVDFEFFASPSENISHRRISGSLTGHLMTAPRGPVSFFIDETFIRASTPVNFEIPPENDRDRNLNRLINRLATGVQVRPGGGAFRFALQYENVIDAFESSDSDFANRVQHLARGRAEWQFLPITRFFFDTSYGFFGPLSSADCGLIKRESRPLRVRLGSSTALTELTSLRAHIGYGKGFYQARGSECGDPGTPDYSTVLLGAELGYRYSPLGRMSVTYEYDHQDSVEANYYRDHALVGRLVNQVDQVLLQGGIDLRLRHYNGVPVGLQCGGMQSSRDAVLARLSGKGYYLYRDWLGFTAELDFSTESTECVRDTGPLGYTRTELQIGAVAAF